MTREFDLTKDDLIRKLFEENRFLSEIFENASGLQARRTAFTEYLYDMEWKYFDLGEREYSDSMHIIEKNIAKECIRNIKNIITSENESLCQFSALETLYLLYRGDTQTIAETGKGFLFEFIYLLRGVHGRSHLHEKREIASEDINAETSGRILDGFADTMAEHFKDFRRGTDPECVRNQEKQKRRILKYFSATEADWRDHRWHLKHIIRYEKTLHDLIKLEEDEAEGIRAAEQYGIPFQITPHYLTLFNKDGRDRHDRIVRAQVIPGKKYCENVHRNRVENVDMDFMGERSNSPIPGITRRYPNIVILKPFDSCPQICVYCQRNWEVKDLEETRVSRRDVKHAVDWIRKNKHITEVLVTGGDPLTLGNKYIRSLLKELHGIGHVERIRVGTRIPVTLPFRIDDELVEIFREFNIPGEKELCVVTHIEDALEITPDVIAVVKKLRMAGINVYNQQVFTYYNSFKFKTAFLRKSLKISGIDPYYLFNTKGKEETLDFRIPIARIEQEQKEEARFLPGIVRTDEPVFNVPKIGKSHLRSWQNHEIVMILPDGERIYRFYPWESMTLLIEDYLYTDVSIYGYLQRLEADGENIEKYQSIWYYF